MSDDADNKIIPLLGWKVTPKPVAPVQEMMDSTRTSMLLILNEILELTQKGELNGLAVAVTTKAGSVAVQWCGDHNLQLISAITVLQHDLIDDTYEA